MGTTANIMLIKNGIIYIANVGDSLSVMYKNKKAYNLNKEHQTIIESEKQRVLKSGAIISGCRINGMLNLTRAIGDLRFKSNTNLKRHEQSVIALPETGSRQSPYSREPQPNAYTFASASKPSPEPLCHQRLS